METITIVFGQDHIRPLASHDMIVVRVFKKGKWFFGRLSRISFRDAYVIQVEPIIHYERLESHDEESLVTGHEKINTFFERQVPFQPTNAIIDTTRVSDGERVWITFDDGHMVFSIKTHDIDMLTSMIKRCRVNPQEVL